MERGGVGGPPRARDVEPGTNLPPYSPAFRKEGDSVGGRVGAKLLDAGVIISGDASNGARVQMVKNARGDTMGGVGT